MEEKVKRVNQYYQEYGLNQTLQVIGLPKSTWYYSQKQKVNLENKYGYLKDDLFKIAREHPGYGYRRTTAELNRAYGHQINHKTVAKLNQSWELPIIRQVKHPQPSGITRVIKQSGNKANLVAQINSPVLFQICYTDFSQVTYANGRKKAQFMPLLEHLSKLVPGWALGEHDDTQLALLAWFEAKRTMEKLGFPIEGLIVHQDQDPVYTSYDWHRQILLKDKARLSFAEAGARENPEMESFFGRFKTENKSLFLDCETLEELRKVVKERILYYNNDRRHSSLGNISPREYIKNCLKHHTKTRTN